MTLQAINDKSKCAGQDNTGNSVCADRERCGRYVRPDGDRQVYSDFWKAGKECQWYESVLNQHHQEQWPDDSRIDVIGSNGNDGLHYDAA